MEVDTATCGSAQRHIGTGAEGLDRREQGCDAVGRALTWSKTRATWSNARADLVKDAAARPLELQRAAGLGHAWPHRPEGFGLERHDRLRHGPTVPHTHEEARC